MLRVTRQNVEALAEGVGKLRITRQNIEVLYFVSIEREATDTLSFSQEAKSNVADLLAEDSLSYSDESVFEAIYDRIITDSLVFTQETDNNLRKLLAEDTLSFSDESVFEAVYDRITIDSLTFNQEAIVWTGNLSAENILSFSENAFIPNVIERTALDLIVFNQEAIGQSNSLTAEDVIPFIDVVDCGVKVRILEDVLSFNQEAIYDATVKRPFIYETLSFTDEVVLHGSFSFHIEDNLIDDVPAWDSETGQFYWVHYGLGDALSYQQIGNPGESNWLILTENVNFVHVKTSGTSLAATDTLVFVDNAGLYDGIDILVFNQMAEITVSRPIHESFIFLDTIALNQVRNFVITDDFNIYHALSYELIKANTYCKYSPFVGSSSDPDAPTPPSITPPTLVRQNNIQLTYDATVLTLRGPEYSDRDRLYFQRIKRETRGGTLIIYADPLWPKTQMLALDFVGLTETESQEVLDFIIMSLGKIISIRDWENQTYDGIIMNPDNSIVRNRIGNNSIALEIELI